MILGFKDRFLPFVKNGTKTHTIRAGNRWRAGMRVDIFENVRQKSMRLLFRAPVRKVESVVIDHHRPYGPLEVTIDGIRLSDDETQAFFFRDGFRGEDALLGKPAVQAKYFWAKQLKAGPFIGQIIHWDYDQREPKQEKALIRLTLDKAQFESIQREK